MADIVSSGNSIQFIKTQNIAQAGAPSGMLRPGDSVFVRVLSNNGGGNYTVSFSGNRFNVKSNAPLTQGESFKALVSLTEKGQVQLQIVERNQTHTSSISLNTFLASQGFASDEITKKILSLMQQSGFRINQSLVQKAKKAALSFPGKEKLAAEIAAILLEKGLSAEPEVIAMLMDLLDDEKQSSQENQDKNEGWNKTSSSQDIYGFLASVYQDSKELRQAVPGLLSLVNQIKTGNMHWIFLPFEYSPKQGISGSGMIRILLNIELKNTQKIEINYKNGLKSYYFILYYDNSKVKEIRFCTLPPLLTPDISKEEKRLGELFSSGMNNNGSVTVTYSSSALIDGFCADGEEIPVFDQKV